MLNKYKGCLLRLGVGDALGVVCNSPEALKYWEKLLKPHLPDSLPKYSLSNWSDHYSRSVLFGMQLTILDRLNDEAGFYKLIERLYRKDHGFCLAYINRLKKDGRAKDAIKAAEERVRYARRPAFLDEIKWL